MKRLTTLVCMLTFIALSASAHKVTLTVKGIRNDEGQILVMVDSKSFSEPLYAAAAARKGSIEITLDLPEDQPCDIRLFHDHDSDFKMRTDKRGAPRDGAAVTRYNPAKGKSRIAVSLYYAE
ncbi:MAG: DUF2141 domain-containing protein [Alistipes sp.]|nr:DUF2141 domain-containing protein [Alistipes sp.]MDE7129354.1 DUF2141 domain-containing protein [Alistipes sp.]